MSTHIAFLRAINLGRTRKLPMVDLRSCLAAAGLTEVETYIQTGNVRLRTSLRSRSKVEKLLEDLLADHCGFEVPVITLTPVELRQVYVDAVSLTSPAEPSDVRRYVTLLKEEPTPDAMAPIDDWSVGGERAKVLGRAVHWIVPGPTQQARLSNAAIEKRLGVGTTRDLKVITTLAQRWGA
jgi:uncharacterized protein (DUF1697 family)